jgi:hypothetical protein
MTVTIARITDTNGTEIILVIVEEESLQLRTEIKEWISTGSKGKEGRKNQSLSPLFSDENDDVVALAGGATATRQTSTI